MTDKKNNHRRHTPLKFLPAFTTKRKDEGFGALVRGITRHAVRIAGHRCIPAQAVRRAFYARRYLRVKKVRRPFLVSGLYTAFSFSVSGTT
jgi:hypothetical protein